MTVLWSYGLAAVAVCSTWLIGEKNTWGWVIGVAQQFLWIVYALLTAQHGFIISSVIFLVINVRSCVKWRRADRERKEAITVEHAC